jgi:hypothetical protein
MANVNCMVDRDVFHLIDTNYVEQHLDADVNITFACEAPDDREDDYWVDEDGKTYIMIKLPYEEVKTKTAEEVREMMLKMALERVRRAA